MNEKLIEAVAIVVVPLLIAFLFKNVRIAANASWKVVRSRIVTARDVLAEMREHVSKQNTVLDAVHAMVKDIRHEVFPNNGGSFRDEGRQNHALMLALFASNSNGQFVTDAKGMLQWTNELFRQWTGRSEVELQGRGIVGTVVEADQARFKLTFQEAVDQQYEFRGSFKLRMVTEHGINSIRTDWRMQAVRDPTTEKIVRWAGDIRRHHTGVQPAFDPATSLPQSRFDAAAARVANDQD